MADLRNGGWLASRKRLVALVLAALPFVAAYLTGDISLTDLAVNLVSVLGVP